MYQYLKETGLVKNADKNLFIEAKSPVVALRSAGDGTAMPEKRLSMRQPVIPLRHMAAHPIY